MASIIMTTSLESWYNSAATIITPQYLQKRLSFRFFWGILQKIYWESQDKGKPWLTHKSLKIIDDLIRPADTVLEFGSGQSTLWFCQKVRNVVSVEHDISWYKKTKELTKNHRSLKLFLRKTKKEYLDVFKKISGKSIDVCLVDGQWRRDCLLAATDSLKAGGILILDNAETIIPVFWPSISCQNTWQDNGCPEKSKTLKLTAKLKKWRFISTSDISQDTVIFIKP